jgi:dienelactone hydrolase
MTFPIKAFLPCRAILALLLACEAFAADNPAPTRALQRPYTLSELNKNGIPPLLDHITTPEQWAAKKSEILKTWLDYMGGLPVRPAVAYEVVSTEKLKDHTRKKIIFNSVDGDKIPAFLLIPDSVAGEDSKFPAILALHPTNPYGKTSIATAEGMKNRTYAYELVSRGYVVLAPDDLTSGERIYPNHRDFDASPFYEKYPQWSTVGKNTVDHLQAMDLLAKLECVDSDRIGVIGHSFGAYNAYFLSAVDPRVKVVVSSCGLNPFTNNAEPSHWGIRPFPYTHLPKVTPDLAKDRVAFEFNEIIALSAPLPMFIYAAQADHLFPHWQSVGACLLDVHKLYTWLKAEDRFEYYIGSGDHNFPPAMRVAAYDFLDRWLKKETKP